MLAGVTILRTASRLRPSQDLAQAISPRSRSRERQRNVQNSVRTCFLDVAFAVAVVVAQTGSIVLTCL